MPEDVKPEEFCSYMAVRTEERSGDSPLFGIARVRRVAGKLKEERMTDVRPSTRAIIRERLRVLNEGRDVLP